MFGFCRHVFVYSCFSTCSSAWYFGFCFNFAGIFSFGSSGHSDTDLGHRTAVVICRSWDSWRSFRFYVRPSRHFCSGVVGVIFGQSFGTFERLWHAPALSSTVTLASQSSTAAGSLPLNASTSSSSPPVFSQLNALPGTSWFLVVPPFVSVFSSASSPFSAPCSSTVYSLPTTVNSAFALRPIVSHTAVPLLAALPLQQPFVVGPGYLPVPYKVVSQITTVCQFGRFVD